MSYPPLPAELPLVSMPVPALSVQSQHALHGGSAPPLVMLQVTMQQPASSAPMASPSPPEKKKTTGKDVGKLGKARASREKPTSKNASKTASKAIAAPSSRSTKDVEIKATSKKTEKMEETPAAGTSKKNTKAAKTPDVGTTKTSKNAHKMKRPAAAIKGKS